MVMSLKREIGPKMSKWCALLHGGCRKGKGLCPSAGSRHAAPFFGCFLGGYYDTPLGVLCAL
uniref:Uncharacterized protein n=1 Tax=uncultured prokaryote TaxID=198431 RepID=A0A0H5Q5P1_9ZZZZ|nr:hypothetical protein [uncultured prokaryote]